MARALSYYNDLALSQELHPMAAQLSMKAALPLAKILATASCRSSKTGPWIQTQVSQEPNFQQIECLLTQQLNYLGSRKTLNCTACPYYEWAFSPLDATDGNGLYSVLCWLSYHCFINVQSKTINNFQFEFCTWLTVRQISWMLVMTRLYSCFCSSNSPLSASPLSLQDSQQILTLYVQNFSEGT